MNFLKRGPNADLIPKNKVDGEYKKLRLQVFIGIFIGYAGYYLVRKNFALAMPGLIEEGFTKGELGLALSGVSIAYGVSKFVMGNLSDRSDARKFMSIGLLLSGITMIAMGCLSIATSSVGIMFCILLVNGWFQGMGWPPSGRVMVHWFSIKERGSKMSLWNIAHNIGGGLLGPLAILGVALFADFRATFYVPGVVAIALSFLIYILVRDSPELHGLLSIEDHKQDYPVDYNKEEEGKPASAKEIFLEHVLNNKLLWVIAIANAFVYLIRYGVLDWAPTYLSEVKDFSFSEAGWAYFCYEWAAIPGTLFAGYASDKFFNGKRAPVSVIYMALVLVALVVYWYNPPGNAWIDIASLIAIGFLIYGPVMLIGLHALDLVQKKAAGTAAGFTGLFGYLFGALTASIAIGYIVDIFGWDGGFKLLIVACILAIILLALAAKMEYKNK